MTKKHPPATTVYELVRDFAERPVRDRGFEALNASSLTNGDPRKKFCGRAYTYAHDAKKEEGPTVSIPFCWSLTYSIGNFVESYVVNAIRKNLIGDWRCSICKHITHRLVPWQASFDDGHCERCGMDGRKHYSQVRIVSKTCGSSGGLDVVVRLGDSIELVEVKSLDKDKFKELKAPLAEHNQRTNLYLRILNDSPWFGQPYCPRVDRARVVYVTKGGFGEYEKETGIFRPVKEFVIKRDDAMTDVVWQQSRETHQYRLGQTQERPERICADPYDQRAAACPFVSQCFGMKQLVGA